MNNQIFPPPPADLVHLAVGYQRSKTLFAIVELRIPTLLVERPLTIKEIAERTGLHPLACDRLMNAGVALKLFARDDAGVYSNTDQSRTYLVEGTPAYLGEQFALYERTSYTAWGDLTQRLREWRPGASDTETPQDADQGAASMRAQHNLAVLVGAQLARAFEFDNFKSVLDLGGGSGAMSISLCREHEALRAIVFDLPEVAKVAREFITAAGLSARIETRDGNFKEDELPEGFDLALLANLLSVSSEETNRQLFRRIHDRLPPGGAIILSGWILDDARTSPVVPVLFCLEDIVWNVPDVERAAHTYETWLRDANFVSVERRVFHEPWSMIVGRKARD